MPEKRGNSQSPHTPIANFRGCGTQPTSTSPACIARLPKQKDPPRSLFFPSMCRGGGNMTPISCGCSSMPTVARGIRSRTQSSSLPSPPFSESHVGTPNEQCAPCPANKKRAKCRDKMHTAHASSRHGLMYKGPSGWRCIGPFIMQVCWSRQAAVPSVFVVLVIAAHSRPGTAGACLVPPPPCFPVLLPGIADTRHRLARPNAAVLDNGPLHREGGLDKRHQYLGTYLPIKFGILHCSGVRRMACVRGTEGVSLRHSREMEQVVQHENLSWATADSARKRREPIFGGLTRAATLASADASMAHPTAVALYLRGASGHVLQLVKLHASAPNVSDPAGVTFSKSMILRLTFGISVTKPCWLKRICMYVVPPLSPQTGSPKRNLPCLQYAVFLMQGKEKK